MATSDIKYRPFNPAQERNFKTEENTIMVSIANNGSSNIVLNGYITLSPGDTFSSPAVPGYFLETSFDITIANDALKNNSPKVLISSLVAT